SMYAAGDFLSLFPAGIPHRPETTEGRVGVIHPYTSTMSEEVSTVRILLRDCDSSGLGKQEADLEVPVAETLQMQPDVQISMEVAVNYLNMTEVLKDHPQLVDFAAEAAKRAGIEPKNKPIRGGTDGSNLTFRGLPTPNIFTGGHNFHGKLEWNSRKGLEKSTETLVHLVQIWAEKGR